MRNVWTRLVRLAAAVCCVLGGAAALGYRYEIVPWTQGWTAAKAVAEARDWHLATITSEAVWNAGYALLGTNVYACCLGEKDAGEEGV